MLSFLWFRLIVPIVDGFSPQIASGGEWVVETAQFDPSCDFDAELVFSSTTPPHRSHRVLSARVLLEEWTYFRMATRIPVI